MTKIQESQANDVARAVDLRTAARRKLATMAYVELGQDNGGILLNIGEGGLAVQSALALSAKEFPDMRFQLPTVKGWVAAKGRVMWMSDSRTEAGIHFLDISEEMRAQIRRWVAVIEPRETARKADAPGPQRKPIDGAYPAQRENVQPRAPETGARAISHNYATPKASSRAAGSGTIETRTFTTAAPEKPVGAAVPENSPAQNFRFNDYSMFSADAGAENVWIEPPRPRRNWTSFTLLAMCLAILFFVLGASVGRGKLDQLLKYGVVERQGQTAQKDGDAAATNSAPNATVDKDSSNHDPQTSTVGQPPAATGRDAEQPQLLAPLAEQKPSDENSSGEASSPTSGETQTEENAREVAPIPPANVPAPSVVGKAPERVARSRSSLRTAAGSRYGSARSSYAQAQAQTATFSGGNSILVNAPAPGAPPFFVSLTNEAVSASQWVAISARRSVRIAPKLGQNAFAGPERLTIGKLISHSEPFYPSEARDKRVEGDVTLRATIDRTGEVIDVVPLSGNVVLAAAAKTALREWRYEPTFINGDPVETQAEVTMVFRLR